MPGCQASFHSGWGTPRGEISDPSVPLKCPPGARAPPASLCRLPPAGAALTNSLLLLYKLSSRWQRPSLGVRMAPSFPSPAKWKPSSVANTSSLVTLRQPISSCGGERPGFPGVPAAGGAEAELGVAAWAVCPPLLRLPGSRGPEAGPSCSTQGAMCGPDSSRPRWKDCWLGAGWAVGQYITSTAPKGPAG